MLSCSLLLFNLIFSLSPVFGVAQSPHHQLGTVEDVLSEPNGGLVDTSSSASTSNNKVESDQPTVFNGIEVPPMKEINGEEFDKEIRDGYWYK